MGPQPTYFDETGRRVTNLGGDIHLATKGGEPVANQHENGHVVYRFISHLSHLCSCAGTTEERDKGGHIAMCICKYTHMYLYNIYIYIYKYYIIYIYIYIHTQIAKQPILPANHALLPPPPLTAGTESSTAGVGDTTGKNRSPAIATEYPKCWEVPTNSGFEVGISIPCVKQICNGASWCIKLRICVCISIA